jgi:hypothetical protein
MFFLNLFLLVLFRSRKFAFEGSESFCALHLVLLIFVRFSAVSLGDWAVNAPQFAPYYFAGLRFRVRSPPAIQTLGKPKRIADKRLRLVREVVQELLNQLRYLELQLRPMHELLLQHALQVAQDHQRQLVGLGRHG